MNESPSFATSLLATLLSTLGVVGVAGVVGLVLGSVAARRAGVFDDLLRRLIELTGALPIFVAIPLLSRVWPASLSTIVVLGIVHGLRLAKICRNETDHVSAEGFVAAARNLGLGARRTHYTQTLPLVIAPVGIGLMLVLPWVVGVEAALGVLGLSTTQSLGMYLIAQHGPESLPLLLLIMAALILVYLAGERRLARLLGP